MILLCCLIPGFLDRAAVEDALPYLPRREAVQVMLRYWNERVRYLEEGGPLWEHRRAEHAQALQYAKNARWAWNKADDVMNPGCTWRFRRACLEALREKGYWR